MRKFEGYQKGVNLGGWLSQADEKTKEHYDTFILREDIEKIASSGLSNTYNITVNGIEQLDDMLRWYESRQVRARMA